ncbi:hypothetical protein CXB51_009611 [Gossypium anomalum]|uniref:Peptidase C1A papain C-terminal domain-containing protein n=1 Tax=Gossypium anomalum TaxID=47600 RepID=A0A8J5YZH3_9ROSI|nr:hypothetical protein CXB51_009611 [Gossypium anomalum]
MMSLIHGVLFLNFWTFTLSLVMSRTIYESAIVDKHERWIVDYSRKYESKLEKEKHMTHDEFIVAHTGYKMGDNSTMSQSTSFMYESFSDVPTSIDWRKKGTLTPIKSQACCWAFSAVAAIEGIIQIKTGKLISLSEQQLLDCSTNGGNRGCNGVWMMNAFDYIIQNQGITTEEGYPYQSMQETCDPEKQINKVDIIIKGYQTVPINDEQALLKVVANQPVSVALEGHGLDFRFYNGGVFTGDCGNSLTHAVTIVGYGTSDEGLDYWVVKNSWGKAWGENGYMRIQRNVNKQGGLCGIAMKASYISSIIS